MPVVWTAAVAVAVAMPVPATPARADDIPPPGKVATSANVKHLGTLPKLPGLGATTNSDIAFQDDHAYVGNYGGFSIYDIKNPARAKLVSGVLCPGYQMDVAVHGNLLFTAVDEPRSNDSCASTALSPGAKESWEGVRIFDVGDKSNPRYIQSVRTDCGAHTLTLVPPKGKDRENVYLYVSSYDPSASLPGCTPPHDKISVIKVPLRSPVDAAVVSTPVVFPKGGNATQSSLFMPTSGCHDITVYPEKDIAAGACLGDGVLFDISDRERPVLTASVTDPNFAFWHSATFDNRGNKVVFADELGGGSTATCNESTRPTQGADAVYEIVKGRLVFKSYFKIPRHQASSENCVAHNGSLIPVKGKDIMVQAWYQGGVSFVDFTDPADPREFGYFERGPEPDGKGGGIWSAYYYNGHVYASDYRRGLDVLRIDDRRTDPARRVRTDRLNVQTQGSLPERRR
ncbi:hypothetical protein [Streptosporangium sp. NPDC023615]|uniref:LVIVD repeat-containing protein n=1 Tax=Streptosporangium sp. NPDC023615 TaxID=3154794 RepID=UPI00341E4577